MNRKTEDSSASLLSEEPEDWWKTNRKWTQLRGLAEEWNSLGRWTGVSPYRGVEHIECIEIWPNRPGVV